MASYFFAVHQDCCSMADTLEHQTDVALCLEFLAKASRSTLCREIRKIFPATRYPYRINVTLEFSLIRGEFP